MIRSPKRVTRKDLRQPDQFVTFTSRSVDFARKNTGPLLAGLSLIVVSVIGVWGWNFYRATQDRLASQQYSRALDLYHGGKYREALTELSQVASYRSPTYRSLSLLYQGSSYAALEDPKKAEDALKEFLSRERKDQLLRQVALMTLGYTQEKTGRCPEAAASFAEAEKLAGPFKEDALAAKARCSLQVGNYQEALRSYNQILTSFSGSEKSGEISLMVREIEGKMADGGKK